MKAVKFEERERIQTAFDGNFKDRNSPESMLLASAASAQDGYMKFIWLYEEIDQHALYLGFRRVDEGDIPKYATLLNGHYKTFEKWFEFETPGSSV